VQVIRDDLERAAQSVSLAHEEAAALERLIEPLVRVERDRVRELEASNLLTSAVREDGEATVRAVHVQPDAVGATDLGQLGKGIDGACVRGARIRIHE